MTISYAIRHPSKSNLQSITYLTSRRREAAALDLSEYLPGGEHDVWIGGFGDGTELDCSGVFGREMTMRGVWELEFSPRTGRRQELSLRIALARSSGALASFRPTPATHPPLHISSVIAWGSTHVMDAISCSLSHRGHALRAQVESESSYDAEIPLSTSTRNAMVRLHI